MIVPIMAQQMRTTKNITLEEAEQKVYQMVKQGMGYREISKVGFPINGGIKHFGLSQITKIKQKFEPTISTHARDHDKALVFKLFKEGWSQVEVIIETGFDSDFVRESYREYLEFENYVLCPKAVFNKMHSLVLGQWREHVDPNYPSSKIGFEEIWGSLEYFHWELQNFMKIAVFFNCA